MTIRAVFFDIGETLINESRCWSALADVLGIPTMTMFGVLGALIAEGRDHRELFDILRPDLGYKGVVAAFSDNPLGAFGYADLYPDAIPCLRELKQASYFVGIAGNQPISQEKNLKAMDLPADLVATSAGWGLKKPDPAFFERIVAEARCNANEIVYVGDRVDNDVIAAAKAGLIPIHIVRGAWGWVQRDWPGVKQARAQLKSLGDLHRVLKGLSD